MDLSLDLSTYHATESRHLVYQDDIGAMSTLALEWRSIPETPSKTPANRCRISSPVLRPLGYPDDGAKTPTEHKKKKTKKKKKKPGKKRNPKRQNIEIHRDRHSHLSGR
jgi:hypothetical protein